MMPEGPEVRTLVDQLQGGVGRRLLDVQFLSGRYVRNGKPDGFKEFAATMTPYSPATTDTEADVEVDLILSWKAKGKFLYIILDDGLPDRSKIGNATQHDFQRSM
jgi:formamidopyrimidine-DNA glycosylase